MVVLESYFVHSDGAQLPIDLCNAQPPGIISHESELYERCAVCMEKGKHEKFH